MPQFDPTFYVSQLVWLAVVFAGLYLTMARSIVPRIADVLEERAERIAADIARAEGLRAEAEEVQASYQRVLERARGEGRKIIGETDAESTSELNGKLAELDQQMVGRLAEANQRIDTARQEALAEVRGMAADLAGDMVQRLAAVKVRKPSVEKVVRETLEGRS